MPPLLCQSSDRLRKLAGFGTKAFSTKLLASTGSSLLHWIRSGQSIDWAAWIRAEGVSEEARNAMVREILMDRENPVFQTLPHETVIWRAWPEGPELRHCVDTPAAFALYPLAGRVGQPPSFGLAGRVGERHILLNETGSPQSADRLPGRSWTLADRLAGRMLEAAPEEKALLASKWVITGHCMGDGSLESVEFGNKTELCSRLPGRSWLFPRDNGNLSLPPSVSRVGVGNLEDAEAVVRDRGVLEGAPIRMPQSIPVLHSFTSLVKEPLLMAAHLMNPKQVVLWKTLQPDSVKSAEILQDLLENRMGIDCEIRPCDDRRIAVVERTLKESLGLHGGNPVYFNVTQGNMLMRAAVFELARHSTNLKLIYRNGDIQRPEFEMVHFPRGEAVTQTLSAKGETPGINWDALYETDWKVKQEKGGAPGAYAHWIFAGVDS